ncbi:MAG TPA: hypothetical protein VKV26_23045 [Dehalococcoidia bacterium]|nr:hypothetical protein [Dehalococcoidia bacterium]
MTVLNVLGLVVAVLVTLIAGGSAWLALRDSRRDLTEAQRRERERRQEPIFKREAVRSRIDETIRRAAPARTRLKPYSPEVIAVILLALAAGLWLARLAG